jgi:hypothetical protein
MHFLPARQVGDSRPISFEMLPLASIRDNPNNAREHNENNSQNLRAAFRNSASSLPSLSTRLESCCAATHGF